MIRHQDERGRIMFEFDWRKILNLAWQGLLRRPPDERAHIIETTFRKIIDLNVIINVDRDVLRPLHRPEQPSA